MKDPNDIVAYQQSIEQLRVQIFLVGFDADFEQICWKFLRKEIALDLKECYASVHHELVHRIILKREVGSSDTLTMIT